MATATVEDYLKRIYLEQAGSAGTANRAADGDAAGGLVAMGQLARVVGVAPGTATAMVKALADSGLVNYEPYAGVRLTDHGEKLALHVLRRHRLIEQFLVEVLDMDWSEVHPEAERLEHAISDRLLERIDAYLGRPRTDPHGDPIPTAGGRVARPERAALIDVRAGRRLEVTRVLDQSPDFLRAMARHGLRPGAKVTVARHDEAAGTVHLKLSSRRSVTLGEAAARKILVKTRRRSN